MRRGMTTYTTLRAALISVLVCAGALALALWGAAFPAVNTAAVALSFAPAFLLLTGLIAGFIPMGICAGMTLGALWYAGGGALLLYGGAYLAPMLAAFCVCMARRARFRTALFAVAGALFLSQTAIYAALFVASGGDVYTRAAEAVAAAVEAMPARDSLLYLLCQAGVLGVPEALREGALVEAAGGAGYVFAPEVFAELLKQLRSLTAALLKSMMPSLLVSGSALSAVIGLGLGIRLGRRAAERRAFKRGEALMEIPDLGMPAFSQWHIPRPWGLRVGLLAAGYLLMRFAGSDALAMAGALMWQAFAVCFALQGAAYINFTQKKRGTRRFWRVLVPFLACVIPLLQFALLALGAIDQITDPRALRPAREKRSDE